MDMKDREILRSLAQQVADIADLPKMKNLKSLWTQHNMLEKTRPLLLVYPEGSWREILPETNLVCKDRKAREIEWKLRARIYRYENFHDDMVIEKKWIVHKRIGDSGWGISVDRQNSATEYIDTWALVTNVGGTPRIWDKTINAKTESHNFKQVLKTIADLKKLKIPEVFCDSAGTISDLQEADDLFGDILDVELRGVDHISFHLMCQYIEMRGLTQMMMDLYDDQSFLLEALSIFEQGNKKLVKQYQSAGLLSLNNNETYNSSGGVGYTNELPLKDYNPEQIRPADMWGSAEAQETDQISPEMFGKFVFPFEKRLLENFGLVGYGCCEDITLKLDIIMSLPNLRRISISPWADLNKCAEIIGSDYVFSWKPDPSVMVGNFDEGQISDKMKQELEPISSCRTEIILKDLHTVGNEPAKITKWTDIVQELIN